VVSGSVGRYSHGNAEGVDAMLVSFVFSAKNHSPLRHGPTETLDALVWTQTDDVMMKVDLATIQNFDASGQEWCGVLCASNWLLPEFSLPDFCQTFEGQLPLRAVQLFLTWTQSAAILLVYDKN
jgi:hypothetical protein